MSIKISINNVTITVEDNYPTSELIKLVEAASSTSKIANGNNIMNNIPLFNTPSNLIKPIQYNDFDKKDYYITMSRDIKSKEVILYIHNIKNNKYYSKNISKNLKLKEIDELSYNRFITDSRNKNMIVNEYYTDNIDDLKDENELLNVSKTQSNNDTISKSNKRYRITKVNMTGVINHITEYILYIHDKKEDKYYSMTSDNCYMGIKRSVYNKAISDSIKYKCNIEEYDTDNIDHFKGDENEDN